MTLPHAIQDSESPSTHEGIGRQPMVRVRRVTANDADTSWICDLFNIAPGRLSSIGAAASRWST